MPYGRAPLTQPDAGELDAAVDEAIAACGGDTRGTLKSLIVANGYLEAEVKQLQAPVSNSYRVGSFSFRRATARIGMTDRERG